MLAAASVRVMAAIEDIIGCIWLSHKCIFYPVRNWKTVWQASPNSDNFMWLSKDSIWCMITHMDIVQTLMGI